MSLVISGKQVLVDGVFQPATISIDDGVIVSIEHELKSGPNVVEAGERYVIPWLT